MKKICLCFVALLWFIPCKTWAFETDESFYYQHDLHVNEKELEELILFAEKEKIPFSIVYQLLSVETGKTFDSKAVGPITKYGRAYGMAQFMPETAQWMADMNHIAYKKEYLFNPYYSIKLSICYLHYLQYGDGKNHLGYHNWHKTLTAYNRGMHGLQEYERETGTSVSVYSKTILEKSHKE